ncbi:MAG: hypothetical protein WAR83_04985 [Flavobacteriales bacterium]
MIAWEKPAFGSPFELWREDGLLHLVLAKGARLQIRDMKEMIRLIAALDPSGNAPVLLEFPENAFAEEPAKELLKRVCKAQGHPVAFFTHDQKSRRQGVMFQKMNRPEFPFRVFEWRPDALLWAQQHKELLKETV